MNSEFSTSKIIIKTLVVLLIFTLFVTSVIMVFFPSTASDVAGSLGMQKVSISFEKASYEKTGDINSLATILNYEIYNENNSAIIEYGMEMLNHKYYAEYVNFMGTNSITSMGYNTYCETYILQALYQEGMNDEALAVLSNAINTGYTIYGSGIVLCGDVALAGDSVFAGEMLEIYELYFNSASDIKAYNITLEALILTDSALVSEREIWQARLEELNAKFA